LRHEVGDRRRYKNVAEADRRESSELASLRADPISEHAGGARKCQIVIFVTFLNAAGLTHVKQTDGITDDGDVPRLLADSRCSPSNRATADAGC
jgi:hypothetical protein